MRKTITRPSCCLSNQFFGPQAQELPFFRDGGQTRCNRYRRLVIEGATHCGYIAGPLPEIWHRKWPEECWQGQIRKSNNPST